MVNPGKAGFIEERRDDKNRKEKTYRITEKGETAFGFYAETTRQCECEEGSWRFTIQAGVLKIFRQTMLKNF
jgi:DNA-binding PadR family transcriptional regulator